MASFQEVIEFHGMPAVRWLSRDGASAIATLQGAQLLSWVPAGGKECLYLSPRSPFEAGRPVRGGIPVCFPQFADRGPLAQHGFARTQPWRLVGGGESEEGSQVTLALESSAQTLALWPGTFRLELVATVGGARLDVRLRVANTGAEAFSFTAALHTYFRVPDGPAAGLEGLQHARFVNRGSTLIASEDREVVTAGEGIDRVYFATPPATRLSDGAHVLEISQRGFTDTVVWNPGPERTAQMPDMPPDGFRHMLCVEAAAIEPPVSLPPGAVWAGAQSVRIIGSD